MSASRINPNDLFEQAARMFDSAMQAGITVQRESTKWFTDSLGHLGSPQQWQAKGQAAADEAISLVRKNTDEAIKMMNENAKLSLELLEKAFQARAPKSDADAETVTRESFETAMGALRKNVELIVGANSRVLESWSQIGKIILDGGAPAESAKR